MTALATALSGSPRAIFAPSLQGGAGIGRVLADLLPAVPPGSVVLSAMTAHVNGVVHLPMTAAITIREMTADVA